jgi:hypothetical protein
MQDKRREQRVDIDSVQFPFLGSRRDDHACFQYLIMDISTHGLRINIPTWVVDRERFKKDDLINLHVPFQIKNNIFDLGRIAWVKPDESNEGQVLGIEVVGDPVYHQPIFVSLDDLKIDLDLESNTSIDGLVLRVLKDSFMLKKGVQVYLKHLVPYFSRISKYSSKDYPILKESLLSDIQERVSQHQKKIEAIYDTGCGDYSCEKEIAKYLDLEELRSIMESEVYLEILKIAFETDTVLPYLLAIKELEKKLYSNFNTIVLLYSSSL